MRVIFFGTPEFAVPSLEKLYKSEHEIVSVVTAPDKARGRGRKISFSPVKDFAVKNNIPVLQTENLEDKNFIKKLCDLNADIYIIVAFRILPKEVYTIPVIGAFNLHGSLLPKYRGAAPIQWALIKGEKETGLTTFFLQEKVDTGNIILQQKVTINEGDNLGTLHDKMSILGADLVLRTVITIDEGKVIPKPQDESVVTPAPKITKDVCKIDWHNSAEEINNLIRGLSPYPCAYFVHNNKKYKVYKSKVINEPVLSTGELYQSKNKAFIGCSEGTLELSEVQLEGRKRMTVEEFLRGYSFNN